MMLVLLYSYSNESTDGYTEAVPIEYDSADALSEKILSMAQDSLHKGQFWFDFIDREWAVKDFISDKYGVCLPQVLTLEDWFNKYKA